MTDRICSDADCNRPAFCRGFCQPHYRKHRKDGKLTSVYEMTTLERLQRIGWDVTSSGCWEWRGAVGPKGHGKIGIRGRWPMAHRLMWEAHNGPIPDGMVVRHRCDNPPCVNPDHLEIGTQADNLRDMADRGRANSFANGTWSGKCRKGLHDLSLPDAIFTSRDGRYQTCRQCLNASRRASYWRNKKTAAP